MHDVQENSAIPISTMRAEFSSKIDSKSLQLKFSSIATLFSSLSLSACRRLACSPPIGLCMPLLNHDDTQHQRHLPTTTAASWLPFALLIAGICYLSCRCAAWCAVSAACAMRDLLSNDKKNTACMNHFLLRHLRP